MFPETTVFRPYSAPVQPETVKLLETELWTTAVISKFLPTNLCIHRPVDGQLSVSPGPLCPTHVLCYWCVVSSWSCWRIKCIQYNTYIHTQCRPYLCHPVVDTTQLTAVLAISQICSCQAGTGKQWRITPQLAKEKINEEHNLVRRFLRLNNWVRELMKKNKSYDTVS